MIVIEDLHENRFMIVIFMETGSIVFKWKTQKLKYDKRNWMMLVLG
jgi:hypothetical protein